MSGHWGSPGGDAAALAEAGRLRPGVLPPASGPYPRCPKCGCAGASYRYAPAAHDPDGRLAWGERLMRRCSACGYAWEEACADAAPGDAP